MPNKIFNNERPSNIKPESVFYGKMTSGGSNPMQNFTNGMSINQNIDYGNQYTQKISDSNTTIPKTRKNGLMYR